MPYICSKCGENITKEYAEKTTKKFGDAYCEKCVFDLNSEGEQSKQDDDPEQVTDQSYAVEGQKDTCEVLSAQGAPSAPQEKPTQIARTIKGIVPQLCECGKIKIGKKGDITTSQKGNTFRPPTKLDHFLVTTTAKDAKGDFIQDAAIMDVVGDECKALNVTVMYDKPELIFPTSYARYDSAVCQCRGDGEHAYDSTGMMIVCNPETCKFAIDKKCKPNGILSVILEDSPRVGGVYKFRTTSWNSIRNITSALEFIRSLTGGYLAGLPMVLTLQPKTTVIPGTKKTTTIYMVNIEYRGTLTEMRDHTIRIATQKATMMDEIARIEQAAILQIGAPESAEECTDVQEEFYPETVA